MNDKYLDLARELKKNYGTWRWTIMPIVIGFFWHSKPKGLLKGLDGLGIWADEWRTIPKYIIENGQNTEKSPWGTCEDLLSTQNSSEKSIS